jgi:hypothetical protein
MGEIVRTGECIRFDINKQKALNHLHEAVFFEKHNIDGFEHCVNGDGTERVLIKYRNGTLWVNTEGGVTAMLYAVLGAIQK